MDSGRYLFLGYPLSSTSPTPPAIPPIQYDPFMTIEKDGANVTRLLFTSHTGTHMDAPLHVISGGFSITDLNPEDYIFNSPLVIDLSMPDSAVVQPEQLEPFVADAQEADLLLFRFGYGSVREQDPSRYSTKSPGFGVSSAEFLIRKFPNMRGIGMDVPSLSCIEHLETTFDAHQILLSGNERRFIVIEDMYLDQDLSELKMVIVSPLMVENLDGAPVTVIGVLA